MITETIVFVFNDRLICLLENELNLATHKITFSFQNKNIFLSISLAALWHSLRYNSQVSGLFLMCHVYTNKISENVAR